MTLTEKEAIASLRILVAVARADGTVHNDERKSLAAALENLDMPGGLTVERLLDEPVDLESQLRELGTPEVKEQVYRSAYFMAYADGTCTNEEKAMLERIADATEPSAESRTSLDRMFVGRVGGSIAPRGIDAIEDPVKRAKEIDKRATRYAVASALLGAFPIPGIAIATDLAVIGIQLTMIGDIAALFGHNIDQKTAKSLLYGVGLGTGARLAVANLAKLLPGWGSVVGGTTSFVSTFALAKVIQKYFEEGKQAAPETLRSEFKAAEEHAKSVYAEQKDVIIESQRAHKATLEQLTTELRAGRMTQAEFDARVAKLV